VCTVSENNQFKNLRFVLKKKDIMTFINGLHDMQSEMIEEAVSKSQLKEARQALDSIMKKSGSKGLDK
jgi:SPX domain protein involved in polyphosphate accumulation